MIRAVPMVALALLAAACSGGVDGAVEEMCDAPLNTWQGAQQRYLDDVADASAADLDTPSPALVRAGERLGNALLEAGREAAAVGCEAELAVGSTQRCERIERLEAGGEGAASVLEGLKLGCR